MELKGKTVNFLGDSITEGHGVAEIGRNRYDNRLRAMAGLKAVNNYGIGGTRLAYQSHASTPARNDLYFCGRAFSLDPAADITVVFGGTNDYGHGDAPFGSMADQTPDTFCGAVEFLMTFLAEAYPATQIVFLTPARRQGDLAPSPRAGAGRPLKDYCQVILEKGREHGIPVLDLYERLGIDPNRPEDAARYAPDGLHLNDAGHGVLAALLLKFLQELQIGE